MSHLQPMWAWQAGNILRIGEACTVIDETGDTVHVPDGALILTGGYGTMVLMETGEIFTVDELDALVMEYDAELLS